MIVSHRVNSDIWNNEHVVQSVGMMAAKNILVDTLRDVFRSDREYKYVDDVFGFPKTPGQLGLDPAAGLYDDEETTRIMIGSTYRYDVRFFPAITVKNTSSRYKPISFSQNLFSVIYRQELLSDGYGNSIIINTPAYHTLVGAWDQAFEIKISAESEVDREEISDIVQTVLIGPRRLELQNAGLFIQDLSSGGEQEEPYANGYIYTNSVTLNTRSEWKIHIPISNVVDRIMFGARIGDIKNNRFSDPLAINTMLDPADQL